MKIIVLAGGGGTRLWPLSKQDVPKQFLRFGDPLSLLQKTVDRFLRAAFVEEIVVATNERYRPLVESQLKQIHCGERVSVIVEPLRRNTAGAIALSVKYLQERQNVASDAAILVIPSDHLIEPQSVFLRSLEDAHRTDRIVLFGIRPSRPETGYGYIQIGAKEGGALYRVVRFVEKPDRITAEQYLSSGDYYWNAGIFAFSPGVFWKELQELTPAIYECMRGDFSSCLTRYGELPDLSFDYAVLEKTRNISVCPLPISWSDIGCWDSVYEVMCKDSNQNVKMGNVLDIDTKNSLIFGGSRLISTIGLEDVLIVETEEATFIGKKGESQKVRDLVQRIAQMGRREDWGDVKPIYSGDGFCVERCRIHPGQRYEREVRETEVWTILMGEFECRWEDGRVQALLPTLSFQALSKFTLVNLSTEISEALVVIYIPK